MVKSIRLSADGVTGWSTLPGNSGELSNEAGQLDDTIFGQEFQSNHPGLIGWTINANAILKGIAGYEVGMRIAGAPVVMTAQPMSAVPGEVNTFQITDVSRRIMDIGTVMTFYAAGVIIADSDILWVDPLQGKVRFTGPQVTVTTTGAYRPTTVIGGTRDFTLTQTAEAIDETTIPEAQLNDGHFLYGYGLKTVSLDISGVYAASNQSMVRLKSREEYIVEIRPRNNDDIVARGYFRYVTQGQSGEVGQLEEESITLSLSVPVMEKLRAPFTWHIAQSANIPAALRLAIESWQNKLRVHVDYTPDGLVGGRGEAVVTDISLAGGLDSMNEFTVNLQGHNEMTFYP